MNLLYPLRGSHATKIIENNVKKTNIYNIEGIHIIF
jgi:hypothetical protein